MSALFLAVELGDSVKIGEIVELLRSLGDPAFSVGREECCTRWMQARGRQWQTRATRTLTHPFTNSRETSALAMELELNVDAASESRSPNVLSDVKEEVMDDEEGQGEREELEQTVREEKMEQEQNDLMGEYDENANFKDVPELGDHDYLKMFGAGREEEEDDEEEESPTRLNCKKCGEGVPPSLAHLHSLVHSPIGQQMPFQCSHCSYGHYNEFDVTKHISRSVDHEEARVVDFRDAKLLRKLVVACFGDPSLVPSYIVAGSAVRRLKRDDEEEKRRRRTGAVRAQSGSGRRKRGKRERRETQSASAEEASGDTHMMTARRIQCKLCRTVINRASRRSHATSHVSLSCAHCPFTTTYKTHALEHCKQLGHAVGDSKSVEEIDRMMEACFGWTRQRQKIAQAWQKMACQSCAAWVSEMRGSAIAHIRHWHKPADAPRLYKCAHCEYTSDYSLSSHMASHDVCSENARLYPTLHEAVRLDEGKVAAWEKAALNRCFNWDARTAQKKQGKRAEKEQQAGEKEVEQDGEEEEEDMDTGDMEKHLEEVPN